MLVDEIKNKYSSDVEFQMPIGILRLSDKRNVYNAIRIKYQNIAKDVESKFIKKWDSYEIAQEKVDNIENDIKEFITEGVSNVKDDLFSCKIVEYDEQTIIQQADENGELNDVNEALDTFNNQIVAVLQELDDKKEYREIRKQSRGRWEGATISSADAGFVESYVDNAELQLEMGARNVIEGLGHSAFNAIGNSISERNARKKIEAICNDDENKKLIAEGLEKTIFKLHITLLKLLNKLDEWEPLKEEEIQKSSRLLNNIGSDVLSEEDQNKMLVESWELNPYNDELYIILIQKDIDKAEDITKVATYFGVDLTAKKDLIAIEYLDNIIGTTEEDAWSAKEKLMEYYKKLSMEFSEDLESYQKLDNIIKKFDLEYRTVEEFECTTRQEADKSREELESIKEFIAKIEAPTKDSLLDYEENLLKLKDEYTNQFSSEIAQKYAETIEKYLSEFDKLFCSVGMLKNRLERKEAGETRAVKYAKELDVSTEQAVQESKEKLKAFLPLVGLTEGEAQKAFETIDKQREKLVNPTSAQKVMGKLGGLFKH